MKPDVDMKILQDNRERNGFNWLRIGTNARLVNLLMNFWVPHKAGSL